MALEILFEVTDKASPEIKKLQSQLKTLNPQIKNIDKSTSQLSNSLTGLAKQAIGAYLGFQTLSKAYNLTITRGLKYNESIESQTKGLTSLIFATDKYIQSIADVTDEQTRFTLSAEMAVDTMAELERINANTPQSLEQTAKIYKSMLPSMQDVGATTADLIKLTEKLAIASDATNIEFNSLLAGVDGLATGTVLANSDLGRFLGAIGLTNKALKETDDVMGTLLNSKLGQFRADTDKMSVVVSGLNVQWDKLTGTLTKNIFETQKEGIKDLTTGIQLLTKDKDTLEDMVSITNSLFGAFVSGANLALKPLVGFAFIIETTITTVGNLGLQVEKVWVSIERNITSSILGIQNNINTLGSGAIGKLTGFTPIDTVKTEKELINLQTDVLKIEEKQLKNLLSHEEFLDSIVNLMQKADGLAESYKENLKGASEESKKIAKVDGSNVSTNSTSSIFSESSISKANTTSLDVFSKLLSSKAFDIEDPVRDFLIATNQMSQSVKELNNLSIFEGFIKKYADVSDEVAKDLAEAISIGIKGGAKILFNSVYDGIRDGYKDSIALQEQQSRNLGLQSTALGAFGQSGASALLDYQQQIVDIGLQETLNQQSRELNVESAKYQEVVMRLTEGIAIAGGVVGVFGGGAVNAIETLLNSSDLADNITNFSDIQQEYIDGTETLKQQYRDLQETLIDVSSAVFDNIDTFEDFYDTLTGSSTFADRDILQAVSTLGEYTDLTTNSIAEFIEDVITAQENFVNGATTIASGGDAELIKSIDIFDKYGLAVDSLNDSLINSVDIVSNLVYEQNEANSSIKDYVATLRTSINNDLSGARFDAQKDVVRAIRLYQDGQIGADELLESSENFNYLLNETDDKLRQQLATQLEQVATAKTSDQYLADLAIESVNTNSLLTNVTETLSTSQSVDVQTLEAINSQTSIMEQLINGLAEPLLTGIDFISDLLQGIKVVLDLVKGVLDFIGGLINTVMDFIRPLGDLLKNVIDFVRPLGDLLISVIDFVKPLGSLLQDIKNAIDSINPISGSGGIGDSITGSIIGGIVGGSVGSIAGAFGGWADGGYTGSGGKYEVAGAVHKGEYVIPQWMVSQNKPLIGALESVRSGRGASSNNGQYYNGGTVSSSNSSTVEEKLDIIADMLMTLLLNSNKDLKIKQDWNTNGIPIEETI